MTGALKGLRGEREVKNKDEMSRKVVCCAQCEKGGGT